MRIAVHIGGIPLGGRGSHAVRSTAHRLPRMLKVRQSIRAVIGLVAALATSAMTGFVVLAANPAGTSITITVGTCTGGGTSFCFNPEAATAETGVPITWTDQSGVAHAVASCTFSACPAAPPSTGTNTFDVLIAANGHGSFSFTSPGTYYYYCTIHGYAAMHGRITVTGAPTPPPTPSPTPPPTSRPTAKPTHAPSMKPASSTPRLAPATEPSHSDAAAAPSSPTVPVSPAAAPPTTINSSTPTPPVRAVTTVSTGVSMAVPIAFVVIFLLIAAGAGWYLAHRPDKRQAG
jgi:plastocyanin